MTDFQKQGRKNRLKGGNWEQRIVRMAKAAGVEGFRVLQTQGEKRAGSEVILNAVRERGEVTGVLKEPVGNFPEYTTPVRVEAKAYKSFPSSRVAKIVQTGQVAAIKVNGMPNGSFFALSPELFFNLLRGIR